ncbi:MAG: hypothetical protein JNG84_15505 [Archangium sp.]|nr:hypothetical protein [Archangium sp.]
MLSSLLVLSSGCATLHPRALGESMRFEAFGEAGDVRLQHREYEKNLAAATQDLEPEALVDAAPEVKIFERALPTGVTVKEGVISASPESSFDVVGTFTYVPPARETNLFALVWFNDYSGVGRKILCYPQVPLEWVSLGMWGVLSPTAYPCIARGPTQDEGYGLLRVAAKAAGASVAVIGGTSPAGVTRGFYLRTREAKKEAPRSVQRRGTPFEFLATLQGFPYHGTGGCKSGNTYVRARLKSALDGVSAGAEVVLRLERNTLATSRAGDTFELAEPKRAGSGKDGTPVYCHTGTPPTSSPDEMVRACGEPSDDAES